MGCLVSLRSVSSRAPTLGRLLIASPTDTSRMGDCDRFTGSVPAVLLVAAVADRCPQVIAVHAGDELNADLLGANSLAFVVVGAVAEALGVHLRHHLLDAL